jgi:hypothetical protein
MAREEHTKALRRINRTLDEIRSILIHANRGNLDTAKKELLKEGTVKKQVYDLCDGSRTTGDIAASLHKEENYVNSYISVLRREGFVRTRRSSGKAVHEQVF